jgi:hypothetical protein
MLNLRSFQWKKVDQSVCGIFKKDLDTILSIVIYVDHWAGVGSGYKSFISYRADGKERRKVIYEKDLEVIKLLSIIQVKEWGFQFNEEKDYD